MSILSVTKLDDLERDLLSGAIDDITGTTSFSSMVGHVVQTAVAFGSDDAERPQAEQQLSGWCAIKTYDELKEYAKEAMLDDMLYGTNGGFGKSIRRIILIAGLYGRTKRLADIAAKASKES